ncbi:peptidase MA family metallohydrolase [Psychrobacillus sp. L4]|uniref:peptidase MA family metallohydrolase n=1 Tax=Psychrobacillus sp. L4 TaxID=3236892 RepID=UPI0036F32D96
MSKKTFYILVFLIVFLLLIKIAVSKYKENIPQLMSALTSLERVEKDKKEELLKEYNKMEYKHLTIYYLESDKELLPATKTALERGIILNEKLIGSYNKPYDVVLFKNNDQIESFSNLEYAIGFNSISMNMLGILPENREGILNNIGPTVWLYNKNVIHEYTHYVLTQKLTELELTDGDIPLWFSEGIAEYIGSDGIDYSNIDTKIVPIKQLSTYAQWNSYRINPEYDIYLQSYLTVRYLINNFGNAIINEIIIQTQIKGNFDEGFQSATGLVIDNLSSIY